MAQINGTPGNDNGVDAPALIGSNFGDTIRGFAGNDLLRGLAGDDTLIGGLGDDTVEAGAGDDLVLLSGGRGQVNGGSGEDRLLVTGTNISAVAITGFEVLDVAGQDVAVNPAQLIGFTTLRRGATMELASAGRADLGALAMTGSSLRMRGSSGEDTLDASAAIRPWFLDGGEGLFGRADHLIGGRAGDTLVGSSGDTLDGGGGGDLLIVSGHPQSQAITVIGGNGSDTLRAGEGSDFSRATVTGVEVLEGSGNFTAAALNGFSTMTGTGFLGQVTPGEVDLNGRITDPVTPVDASGPVLLYGGSGLSDTLFYDTATYRLQVRLGSGNDRVVTGSGDDLVFGQEGRNTDGAGDEDTIFTGNGRDTVVSGEGGDLVFTGNGGDVVYAGTGNDTVDGGFGNDELRGDGGRDSLTGGFGSDTLVGGTGSDWLTGGAISDELNGGRGRDFLNGGFGFDRLNGGDDADSFFHLGVRSHGSDWVQDYDAGEGDLLVWGGGGTTPASGFQVNFARTSGAGDSTIAEAFIIERSSGQVLWALVDGAGQSEINLRIGGSDYDLLG